MAALDGPRELVARAIHRRYRENQRAIKRPGDPALEPWETLTEPLRESNRQQADDIELTLQTIGCGVRAASSGTPIPFVFTDEEVEIYGQGGARALGDRAPPRGLDPLVRRATWLPRSPHT